MNDHSVVTVTTVTSKRDAILDAALELFSERTFASTSMPELAQRAGVGAGTIYRYFDSKDALVNALFQRWKTEMTDTVSGDIPAGLTPAGAVRSLVAGTLEVRDGASRGVPLPRDPSSRGLPRRREQTGGRRSERSGDHLHP